MTSSNQIIDTYFKLPENTDERAKFILKNLSVFSAKNMRLYFSNKDQKKYCYLVTFTLKPEIGDDQVDEIENYIKAQFKRTPLKVDEAHIVRELTKKGKPHWHVVVQTSIPLLKNRFAYYKKIYGFIDISKTKCQTLDNGLEYISKSGTPEKVV